MARLKFIRGDGIYPDPFNSASTTANPLYPNINAFTAGRGTTYRTNAETGEAFVGLYNTPRSADFIFWARANALQRTGGSDPGIFVSSYAVRNTVFENTISSGRRLDTGIAFNPTGGASFVIVFSPSAVSNGTLLASFNAGAGSRMLMQILSGGELTFRILNGASDRIGRQTGASFYSVNGKYVIIGTYDGGTTNSGIKLFSNGVQVDTTDFGSGSYSVPGAGDELTIGETIAGTSSTQGLMSDCAYYSKELSTSEISEISSTLMNKHNIAGAPEGASFYAALTDYSDLEGWWNGDRLTDVGNGTLSALLDQSGNGNDAEQSSSTKRPFIGGLHNSPIGDQVPNVFATTNQIDVNNLQGLENNDILAAIDLPDSRYWAISSVSPEPIIHEWFLVSISNALDLGRFPEPNFQRTVSSGFRRTQTQFYSLTFNGVSHSLTQELEEYIEGSKFSPLVLYDEDSIFIKNSFGTFQVERLIVTPVTRDANRIVLSLRTAQ
jgi:hypothetical protein